MNSAPFGSSSNRFTISGLHPQLLTRGHIPHDTTHIPDSSRNMGPGTHDLLPYSEFSEKNVNRRADGPNWKTALNTEKMAKIPHLLFKDTYYKRKEHEKRLGPGCYDIKDGLELNEAIPRSKRGMLDALSPRFPSSDTNAIPGPGAYGVPDAKLEEKKWSQGGKVQLFERSKQPRSLPEVGCEVPPGTYEYKNSTDELIKKKVSNRGPYDVFSSNRTDPVKTGHYTKVMKWNLGPGQYNIPSLTDDLVDYSKEKHGKFGKIAQYPKISGDRLSINYTSLQPKDPDFPGPGYHSPMELSKVKTNLPAFLISTTRNDKRSQQFFYAKFQSMRCWSL